MQPLPPSVRGVEKPFLTSLFCFPLQSARSARPISRPLAAAAPTAKWTCQKYPQAATRAVSRLRRSAVATRCMIHSRHNLYYCYRHLHRTKWLYRGLDISVVSCQTSLIQKCAHLNWVSFTLLSFVCTRACLSASSKCASSLCQTITRRLCMQHIVW